MGKTIIEHLATFDYIDQTLPVLLATSSVASITLFLFYYSITNDIGAPLAITRALISLVFSLGEEYFETILRIIGKNSHNLSQWLLLAKGKLNNKEKIIFKAMCQY